MNQSNSREILFKKSSISKDAFANRRDVLVCYLIGRQFFMLLSKNANRASNLAFWHGCRLSKKSF